MLKHTVKCSMYTQYVNWDSQTELKEPASLESPTPSRNFLYYSVLRSYYTSYDSDCSFVARTQVRSGDHQVWRVSQPVRRSPMGAAVGAVRSQPYPGIVAPTPG